MTAEESLPSAFEPFSRGTLESPYAFYRSLRKHAPVYRLPQADYYLVSRYHDSKSVVIRAQAQRATSVVRALSKLSSVAIPA